MRVRREIVTEMQGAFLLVLMIVALTESCNVGRLHSDTTNRCGCEQGACE
jgi:hypothetical protein